uniref:Uncharacterized protein n=1 Tax=Setaria digitata TaxID=48799 RepID=A0A915Q2D1_9BILA
MTLYGSWKGHSYDTLPGVLYIQFPAPAKYSNLFLETEVVVLGHPLMEKKDAGWIISASSLDGQRTNEPEYICMNRQKMRTYDGSIGVLARISSTNAITKSQSLKPSRAKVWAVISGDRFAH